MRVRVQQLNQQLENQIEADGRAACSCTHACTRNVLHVKNFGMRLALQHQNGLGCCVYARTQACFDSADGGLASPP